MCQSGRRVKPVKEPGMNTRTKVTMGCLVLSSCGCLLEFGGCSSNSVSAPGKDAPRRSVRQVAPPPNAFSLLGEVTAFQVDGNSPVTAGLPMGFCRDKVGGFRAAEVYEFDRGGKKINSWNVAVREGLTDPLPLQPGRSYIAYPDLGERVKNTYVVLCRLRERSIPTQLVPRICTQILCSGEMMPASDILVRVPELGQYVSQGELGQEVIGGFGSPGGYDPPAPAGTGSICDHCFPTGGDFIPFGDCQVVVVRPGNAPCGAADRVVFYREAFPTDGTSSPSQIFSMNGDGSNVINLSNSTSSDSSPDVHGPTRRIVFWSTRTAGANLHIMNLDGTGVTPIPGTPSAYFPKWCPGGTSPFIVFVSPGYTASSAIWMINPDGTNLSQITFPPAGFSDEFADVADGKNIVFVRVNRTTWDRDLFVKYIFDSRPEVALTNTPNVSEVLPVVSHNGRLLAYRAFLGAGQDDQVRVAQFTTEGQFSVIHTIDLAAPADINISGIDFSLDDKCLFVSTQAKDVAGSLINRKHEIFSVALDGSNQQRLTVNSDFDGYPSAAPH